MCYSWPGCPLNMDCTARSSEQLSTPYVQYLRVYSSESLHLSVPGNLQRHHARSDCGCLIIGGGSHFQCPPYVSRSLEQPSNLCHAWILMRRYRRFPPSPVAERTHVPQGLVIFLLGALRLGWLVEFIPAPAVGGFVTGSAIQIIASQLPPLLGIKSKGDSSFEIFWNTLRNIRQARLDAALGISGLASLYLFRWICQILTKKYPRHGLPFQTLLYPPSLTWSYSSPDVLFRLRDQERVCGCRPHLCLMGDYHQFPW